MIIGLFIVAVAAWGFFQNPEQTDLAPQRKKMILRKRYWLFYFLTFMAGARRQIFIAFAVFLMVKHFRYSVKEITILFVANNVIKYYLSPLIGRSIVVVANLEPATIRGIESQAMLLAATGEAGMAVVVPDRELPPGTKVS